MKQEYRVNVSSVQSFMQCRFRWWCEWVQDRVPVATAPALDAGRLLHRAFERHFAGEDLRSALFQECYAFQVAMVNAHPAARPAAQKALESMMDLLDACPLWRDEFKYDEVLDVEQAFEWADPVVPGLIWLGRPDRVIRSGRLKYHVQNRGLAQGMNFATYVRLQKRSYHEHLYAEARGLSGTVFNLVRKLKFRTNVGKKNEATKTAEEMFYQQPMRIDLKGPLHKSVMTSLRGHVEEMRRVTREWEDDGKIPSPNEKMNGGFNGSVEDPYFKVLIGEIKLSDDRYFKKRESTYDARDAA